MHTVDCKSGCCFNRVCVGPGRVLCLGRFLLATTSLGNIFCTHLSFCSRGEGVCLSACWDTLPPKSRSPKSRPPPKSRHPPRADTPKSRHPRPRADIPQEQTPPVPAYGQRVAGTHPTGMHSCCPWG